MEQPLQIVVNLGEEFADGGSLARVIIDAAAEKIAKHIEQMADDTLVRQVRGVAEQELREMMRPLLEGAMTQLLQPTDTFGTPRGEPKTLQQVIVEIAQKELSKPGDRYDSRSPSVLQKLIHEEVQRTIRGELQAAMKEPRDQVIATVREEGGRVIADTIARVTGV